jgi:hypothetical protein
MTRLPVRISLVHPAETGEKSFIAEDKQAVFERI